MPPRDAVVSDSRIQSPSTHPRERGSSELKGMRPSVGGVRVTTPNVGHSQKKGSIAGVTWVPSAGSVLPNYVHDITSVDDR